MVAIGPLIGMIYIGHVRFPAPGLDLLAGIGRYLRDPHPHPHAGEEHVPRMEVGEIGVAALVTVATITAVVVGARAAVGMEAAANVADHCAEFY